MNGATRRLFPLVLAAALVAACARSDVVATPSIVASHTSQESSEPDPALVTLDRAYYVVAAWSIANPLSGFDVRAARQLAPRMEWTERVEEAQAHSGGRYSVAVDPDSPHNTVRLFARSTSGEYWCVLITFEHTADSPSGQLSSFVGSGSTPATAAAQCITGASKEL